MGCAAETLTTLDLGSGIDTTSGVALHPDGERAYVVHWLDPELLEVMLATGEIGRRREFGFIDVRDITVIDPLSLAGTVQFDASIYDVSETSGSVEIAVARWGAASGYVSVQYSVEPCAEATESEDYLPTSGVLAWADGEYRQQVFSVVIVADSVAEGSERFCAVLQYPMGGLALGPTQRAEVRILDDDLFSDDFESGDLSAWSGSVGGSRQGE